MTERREDDQEDRDIVARGTGAAAHPLDRPSPQAPPSFLGITIGVARTVQLDRRVSDEEWDHLVVLLRDTFHARGEMREDGSLRQWTNGNLQVLVEPTVSGDRIRMKTRNSAVQGLLAASAALFGVALFSFALGAVRGLTGSPEFMTSLTTLGVAGAGVGLWGAFRLARWAPKRRLQMEEIARRLAEAREE